MTCEKCGGQTQNSYKEDYYGGTQIEECLSCTYKKGTWYPAGGAPWDDVYEDEYEDDEPEIVFQDCGIYEDEDGKWCDLLGSDHCDFCPFHKHLFSEEDA